MNLRYAVHEFDDQTSPFDFGDYSKLKFGDNAAARKFGEQLADGLVQEHISSLLGNRIVVVPSPYNQVKNAATILTGHFVNRLNHHLVTMKGSPVEYSTINRKVSYINDYGFLPADKRKELIDGDEFYFDPGFYSDKLLLFIDDVRITGTHERKLEEILDERQVQNPRMYLYYANYNGSDPTIESRLNFAAVKTPFDYLNIANKVGSHMIVRPIKYLLGLPQAQLQETIKGMARETVEQLYFGTIGDGLHQIPAYQANFHNIKDHLDSVS